MSKEPLVFIAHPLTGELHDVHKAASIIGITTSALYQRIRKGDTGTKLWRSTTLVSQLPSDKSRSEADCKRLLDKIPSLTKFERER